MINLLIFLYFITFINCFINIPFYLKKNYLKKFNFKSNYMINNYTDNKHWNNFINNFKLGDYYGKFTKWTSTNWLNENINMIDNVETIRSYSKNNNVLNHSNVWFFNDKRSIIYKGPWYISKNESTNKGIILPHIGNDKTFLVMNNKERSSAWIVHNINNNNDELFSLELLLSHPIYDNIKFSVTMSYYLNNTINNLESIGLFREDIKKKYWSSKINSKVLFYNINYIIKKYPISYILNNIIGYGNEITIPFSNNDFQIPIKSKLINELSSLNNINNIIISIPDNIYILLPKHIPNNTNWSISVISNSFDIEISYLQQINYDKNGEFISFRHLKFKKIPYFLLNF
jgi:hypothetical protein